MIPVLTGAEVFLFGAQDLLEGTDIWALIPAPDAAMSQDLVIVTVGVCGVKVAQQQKEAAEKFRMESGIEPSVDLETLDERIKIREMILKGQIQEAIALINSLHPELLDTNRYLYFHLQQQHLIELIRQRETEAALEFAQTQLAEQGEESRECLTEMERTLALLAFDSPEESPFGDLLHMMQRQKVWSEVNQAVLDYENRESTPKLAKLLKLLLWAQNELDQKKVKYPKMTDLSKGVIEEPK